MPKRPIKIIPIPLIVPQEEEAVPFKWSYYQVSQADNARHQRLGGIVGGFGAHQTTD